jgi:Gluconate 2-dehydrogenase subunit 3
MNRRTALRQAALFLGGTFAIPNLGLALDRFQMVSDAPSLAPNEQDALIAELADIILPTTTTPGAKAAKVEQFINIALKDCYSASDSALFYAYLGGVERKCQDLNAKPLAQCNDKERETLMRSILADGDVQRQKNPNNRTFFQLLKELTVVGYFTSEIGMKQALRHLPVPGRQVGDMPYKKGDKSWAE